MGGDQTASKTGPASRAGATRRGRPVHGDRLYLEGEVVAPAPALSYRTTTPAAFPARRQSLSSCPPYRRFARYGRAGRPFASLCPTSRSIVPRVFQKIAEEITFFAANLVHHFPQRLKAGRGFTVQPACLDNNRTPAASGQRPARHNPSRWSYQLLFFFQRIAYRVVKPDQILRIQARSARSSASRSCFSPLNQRALAVVGGTR